ncbi:hypothetical protein F5Y07DRAFT_354127 [Xylaria sp. FL0933]|nr:hypothetical protein F5Y07DRAFT_354127 [Xylaria sp. FL0933]
MPQPIQRMRKLFANSAHSLQQQDGISGTSYANTQRPASRPPLQVLYPRPNLNVSDKIEVDIVAVHGLGSSVDWSWTWQDKKGRRPPVHWLKDANMLPSIVPHARILAYSYESRWHSDAPETRLELCGEELVKSLHAFRSDAPERPIIFVAHSLGGLVVLYGLLYADRSENFKYIPTSTVGFAPLGTPFRGTNMQSLAKKVAWLMSSLGSHDGIITELEPDGKHLADQVHAFSELRNKVDIPTTCFFELYDSDYGKKIGHAGLARGKVVEEESAHVPGWGRVQLYADHFQLNKFAGPDDRSFLLVSNELYTMCTNWKRVVERRKQITRDRHFIVPFGRNHHFVGRDAILKQLLEKVPPSASKDDCQRTAIEGLGGIGKTQIALEAAYQIRDRYLDCSIFWVPAVDLTRFENAYREVGRLLQLPGINNEEADLKMLVKKGLSDTRAGSWLLIIDNADDAEMLFTSGNLVDYLPFSRAGSVLFTTRNHEIAAGLDISQENNIVVSQMNDSEATNLLQIGLRESQMDDEKSTKRLLHFLANLPLAIKQASAYMALNRFVTISQHLGFCESSNADLIHLLSRQFEDRHRYKSHARNQNPIATTWLVSFEHISRCNPQATDYLKFMCFLAEKDIPVSLLPDTSKISRTESIGLLNSYAFIQEHDSPGSFDIHRLVRLAMRNWMQEKKEWEQWATNVVQRLAKKYPWPLHENKETWARYLPHAHIVLKTGIPDTDSVFESTDHLFFLHKIARSYHLLGRYSEKARPLRHLLELSQGSLGREHPDTLSCIHSLAAALQYDGKYTEAETIYRQQLERCERVQGREHPSTVISMGNFVHLLIKQGKLQEAEKLQLETLERLERVLGSEHPSTFTGIYNLAAIFSGQWKFEEAGNIQRHDLERRERILGKEHPDTLTSMDNLAVMLAIRGNHEQANKMHQEELELSEKVFGKEHLHTLNGIVNYAETLSDLGNYEEAERMHRRGVELSEKVLGEEHPDTLSSKHSLGRTLIFLERYQETEEIFRETLELRGKVLGRQHPLTLMGILDLAHILLIQGKSEEAEDVFPSDPETWMSHVLSISLLLSSS